MTFKLKCGRQLLLLNQLRKSTSSTSWFQFSAQGTAYYIPTGNDIAALDEPNRLKLPPNSIKVRMAI